MFRRDLGKVETQLNIQNNVAAAVINNEFVITVEKSQQLEQRTKRYLPRFMANPIPPQVQLEKTYNAAADHYDHPALSFWDRFGRRTVERLPLAPGMSILDVCCGMGGSALPAAERVGPRGQRKSGWRLLKR
jgi:ubiquinone/menaquinone biosynthesis C-methylase UbiE